MNRSIIVYIIGTILKIEGVLLLLPTVTALIYHEYEFPTYLTVAICAFLAGLALTFKKPRDNTFYLKEGCVATVLSWLTLSIVGGIPFYASGDVPSFLDAIFESVSGFTTTGSTILNDIEALSHCSLIWRSFIHWIGGLGVLVFLLALIPMAGGSNINLLKTEATGPSVGKLVPKIRSSARILYTIYIALTLCDLVLLLFGGVPFFDALTTAFGTTSTGGFSIHNASMADYSYYAKWVTIVFMVLSSINFNVFYLLILRNFQKVFSFEEMRVYLIIVVSVTLVIFTNILYAYNNIADALTDAAFQTTSIISSTGFTTKNFDFWPPVSRTLIILASMIGGCAGSTGGGFKVSRVIILFKSFRREITTYLHPKSVKSIKMNGETLDEEIVRSTHIYFITYVLFMVVSILVVSLEEHDLITNFTSVVATFNNIGPGLSLVDPAANFDFYHPLSKIILMIDMLAGRLEIFPLIVLCHPSTLKDLFSRRSHSAYRKDRDSHAK